MPDYADFLAALERERHGGPDVGYLYFDEIARQLTGADRSRAEAEIVRQVEGGDALLFELAVELRLDPALRALERIRAHGEPWYRERAAVALSHLRPPDEH